MLSDISGTAIPIRGVVSEPNSTTTTLRAGEVFTGVFVSTLNFVSIDLVVYSDASSDSNGIRIQWSSDGVVPTLSDTILDWKADNTNRDSTKNILIMAPYFRIIYRNSTSQNQNVFRLTSRLNRKEQTGEQLSELLSDSRIANLVRSIIAARREDGTYVNLAVDNSGNLRVTNNSIIDDTNSTSSISLGIGESYTGNISDCKDFAGIHFTTGYTGVGEGFVDWYRSDSNGLNPIFNHTVNSGLFTGATSFDLPKGGTHYRVRFTSTTPGTFVLLVLKTYFQVQPFFFPASAPPNATWGAMLVKNINTAQKPDGTYGDVGATTQGDLRVGQSAIISDSTTLTGPSVIATSGNSFKGTLDAGATYTGAWEDVKNFGQIEILSVTTNSSAVNGALAQFSDDGISAIRTVPATIIGTAVGGAGIAFQFAPEGRFFRIKYTNGSIATSITNQILYKYLPASPVSLPIGANITDVNLASLSRGVIAGKNPTNSYTNVGVTASSNLKISTEEIGMSQRDKSVAGDRTIFGSLSVESLIDDFHIDFTNASPDKLVKIDTSNGGTALHVGGQAIFATGTNPLGSVRAKTRDSISYKPGHAIRIDFTAVFSTPISGANQLVGLFDDNTGFIFGVKDNNEFSFFIRNDGIDVATPRSLWNGDSLDGSATSFFTRDNIPEAIDFTKNNVYRLEFGWLGGAPARWEVLSPDNDWIILHEFKFPNLQLISSISDPNLPIIMEIVKTSGTTNVEMRTGSWRGGSYNHSREVRLSTRNSTDVLLGANETFTGNFEDVLGYVNFELFLVADQSSATDGLQFHWSTDGLSSDLIEKETVSASFAPVGNGVFFSVPIKARFCKIVYVNGPSAQGTFKIQLRFGVTAVQSGLRQIDTSIKAKNSAINTRSIVTAKSYELTDGVNLWNSVMMRNSRLATIDYAPQRNISGIYTFKLSDVVGSTTASTRWLSLFNAIGSGKLFAILRITYSAYATANTNTKNSQHVSLITSATGGTLQSTTTIGKHDSTYPNSVSNIRTGNPTVTLGAGMFSYPPIVFTGDVVSSTGEFDWEPKNEFEEIILREGEGITFHQIVAGDVDQNFNFGITWLEFTM